MAILQSLATAFVRTNQRINMTAIARYSYGKANILFLIALLDPYKATEMLFWERERIANSVSPLRQGVLSTFAQAGQQWRWSGNPPNIPSR